MIKLVDIIFSELLENKEYKIELKNGKSMTKFLSDIDYNKLVANMKLATGTVKSIEPTGKSTLITPDDEPDKDDDYDDDQPKDISVPTVGGIVYNNIIKLLNTIPAKAKDKIESAKRHELANLTLGTNLSLNKGGKEAFISNIEEFIAPYFIRKEDVNKWATAMSDIEKDVKFMNKSISDIRSGKDLSKEDLLKYGKMLEKDKFLNKTDKLYKDTISVIKSEIKDKK